MKKREKKRHFFKIRQLKWVFFLSAVIVIASVMSFGMIGMFIFHFDTNSSIYMLGMIVPMLIALGFTLNIVLRKMEEKLFPLITGLQKVADGDMDIQLNPKNAGEYEIIYQNFNKMTEELRSTKAEMQNFINEFTHEFKTPITSISGFADYLCETGKDIETEERMEYLRLISEQSQRLSNLSQNTLLLSKVEACRIVTDREDFSLSEQIKKCAILLLKDMEKKNITLNIPEDFDFSYYGNEELLEHIWINLLNNALKFTPDNGQISINYGQTETELYVSISDTGIGMSPETQKHIFEKYYQNDTLNSVKGNGIGLSIVKRITELCGGNITVSSRPHCGSTFTVHLPLKK